ncbi:hypothetical protein AB835_02750 [Candidatus Endobugula sertula]|uniref:Addiction module toxin RelE n=1 Tax=Candidatus Endobugula sertula TaxID=62101 RepID=A0A1D2QSU6_9GAMM|nr:hypothetical protein AB835_02750 [Candidatus Endobugula sertula]
MKIQILETAELGIRWMKRYFLSNPQLHSADAFHNYNSAKKLLKEHPYTGEKYESHDEVRELNISKTTFSILYTFKLDTIYIMDIRDQRGNRSADALKKYTTELRKKYDL